VNIPKTSVEVPSFPPYKLERVMATLSVRKFNTLRGADEVLAELGKLSRDFPISLHDAVAVTREAGRKEPKTVVLPVWRVREGACEHAPRE
jgi:hypothetical protein